MLPETALLLHPMSCTHSVWGALLALFLLYRELFSDHELFTDCELRDARTLKNFTMLPDAALLLHPMHSVPRIDFALRMHAPHAG